MLESLLQVTDLSKSFSVRGGFFGVSKSKNVALDRVSLFVSEGETLGLVGESGCGKSTLALTVMRLYEPDSGRIVFSGRDITRLDEKSLKSVRGKMQMVFQDPFASLDAQLTIEQIICEPLEIHRLGTSAERTAEAARLLERVGLTAGDLHRFPGEFSGGQQQRIGIARALALRPKLLICDEPVSALDVSVQAQILNLLRDLQDEYNLSYLFISHNIAVTAFMSERIGVMYLGRLVEIGESSEIINAPRHPYTQMLLAAIPEADPSKVEQNSALRGIIEEASERSIPQKGCGFRSRCPLAREICTAIVPELRMITEIRQVACHLA